MYVDLPAGILVHHLQKVVRVQISPFVHRLGDDVHLLLELIEVLEVGALPRADVSLHQNCEGPGGAGWLDERHRGSGQRSFLYHRQNFGHGL